MNIPDSQSCTSPGTRFDVQTNNRYNYCGIITKVHAEETDTVTASKPNSDDGTQSNRLLQPLLRIPVFYRVLISNSLIIFIGATVGTWLATRLQTNPYPLILIIFVTLGWLVSVVLNFVLLQIAFRPLLDLGKVMNRVQSGERS